MPRTKLTDKVETEKKVETELKDPRKLFPEFHPQIGMWKIKFTGGGRLPDYLEGFYITMGDAQAKIDLFLANK